MKRIHTIGLTAVVACCILCATMLSGCVGGDTETPVPTAPVSLSVTGSTTVLPIAEKAAEAFMDANPGADIQVSGGGSSVGVQAVGEGTADIGMSSRDLKDAEKEKYPGLVQHVVARDGIALIVNPGNTAESLTVDQVRRIYTGEITNWNEVGGSDADIVVVGRDSASGTRGSFEELVMDKQECVLTMLEKNSNGAVQQTIAGTPGAIGYVGLGYVDGTVKGVTIDVDGTLVDPTVENVIAGTYPISRDLNMFTDGEATGIAATFITYILSEEGRQIVADEGFVPVA
ncbi:MAG: phosphate ABC transporter substrate-binding protein [Methanomicrobiaceae archaeon]|nr:phosphate ABC transporter substrate-binding protein [Methanomicrobiaceae archaeon]